MKTYSLLFCVLFSSISFAENDKDIFPPKTRTDIIRAIDDICADTWCEGDYDFKFLEFKCRRSKRHCDLTFQFIQSEDELKKTYSSVQTCGFDNIKELNQILDEQKNLNEEFYETLSNCIMEKERSIVF